MNLEPDVGRQGPRDDATGQYYNDAAVLAAGNPAWDANGNGEMWVRAEGRLDSRSTTRQAARRRRPRARRAPAADAARRLRSSPARSPRATTPQQGDHREPHAGRRPLRRRRPRRERRASSTRAARSRRWARSSPTRPAAPRSPTAWPRRSSRRRHQQGHLLHDLPGSGPERRGRLGRERQLQLPGQHDTSTARPRRACSSSTTARSTLRGGVQWWGMIYMLNAQNCGSSPARTDRHRRRGRHHRYGDDLRRALHRGRRPPDHRQQRRQRQLRATAIRTSCTTRPSSVNITAYGTAGIIQNTWRELLPEWATDPR